MTELPKKQPMLQTDRLVLTSLCKSDAKELSTIANDKDLLRYMSDSLPNPYRYEDALEFIKKAKKSYQSGKSIEYAIRLKNSHEIIGVIGLSLNYKNDHITFGYWLGKKWWKKGYMSEALSEIVRFCFEELKVHRVASHHFHPNIASGKVMQKAGLKYEGRRKEHYKKGDEFFDIIDYGLIRSEWDVLETNIVA